MGKGEQRGPSRDGRALTTRTQWRPLCMRFKTGTMRDERRSRRGLRTFLGVFLFDDVFGGSGENTKVEFVEAHETEGKADAKSENVWSKEGRCTQQRRRLRGRGGR